MKTLLTFFILLFSSSVFADAISDFEIEGMSLGDSLLDYFNEKEIKNNIREIYQHLTDQSFTTVEFHDHSFLKKLDSNPIFLRMNNP